MKLGVYVCSYQQPVFLRHALLQILHQSRRPDTLAIHENAGAESYVGMVEDVILSLEANGVKVLYYHTAERMPMPTFFVKPLQALLREGCDLFVKADHDDLFYHDHLAEQEKLMFNPQLQQPDFDFAMNVNSELLVLMSGGGYRHKPSVDFGIWNPTGAHPNNIIFNRAVAKEFARQLSFPTGLNDDAVLAKYVLGKFKGNKVAARPTSCFVAHGLNVSVANWSTDLPSEVFGA